MLSASIVEAAASSTVDDGAPVVGLTTVHQDVAEHGAHAARAMIDMLTGREVSLDRQNAPIRLVERSTRKVVSRIDARWLRSCSASSAWMAR